MDKLVTSLLLGVTLAATGLAAFACDVPGGGDGILRPATARPPEARDASLARLDPDLRAALRAALADARADGVEIGITSGWRSRAHQQRLFDEALDTYGSAAEASRWVASPDASAHVTGDAVDIGPTDGALWMQQHGAAYGLCQTYANELWHYELRTTPGGDCPEMLADGSVSR